MVTEHCLVVGVRLAVPYWFGSRDKNEEGTASRTPTTRAAAPGQLLEVRCYAALAPNTWNLFPHPYPSSISS
jgi:hypothetical protein